MMALQEPEHVSAAPKRLLNALELDLCRDTGFVPREPILETDIYLG